VQFHRAFVDAEIVCDLFVEAALNHMGEHFQFAFAQGIEPRAQMVSLGARLTFARRTRQAASNGVDQLLFRGALLQEILGAAAHEPVVVFGSSCNKGMAVVARKDSPISTLKDLKGKRVAIWPGSTQEVFILERLHMEGMTIHDIESVRVSFSEMPAALQRGDVDAYVGAEPGPGLSLATGIGKIVEYPYSTPMGSLNMIMATHRDVVDQKPDLARLVLNLQKQGSEYAMSHPEEMVAMTVAKLGMKREAVELSVKNVDLNWKMTPEMVANSKSYAAHMLELKQIRMLPDFATFLDTKISDQLSV